jgi:hypothetical protein
MFGVAGLPDWGHHRHKRTRRFLDKERAFENQNEAALDQSGKVARYCARGVERDLRSR